jgi:hypothetical protein
VAMASRKPDLGDILLGLIRETNPRSGKLHAAIL